MEQLSLIILALKLCVSCDNSATLTQNTTVTSRGEIEVDTITLRFDAPQLVDDATIYEFLNTTIGSDSLNRKLCNAIVAREYYPIFSDKSEAIGILRHIKDLSTIDVNFMYQQSLYSPKFELKKEKLKTEKRLIVPDTCEIFDKNKNYWHNILQQFGSFCSISLPLFSTDRKTVLISYTYNCGALCGDGGYYVFRKENNIWTLASILEEWIS